MPLLFAIARYLPSLRPGILAMLIAVELVGWSAVSVEDEMIAALEKLSYIIRWEWLAQLRKNKISSGRGGAGHANGGNKFSTARDPEANGTGSDSLSDSYNG